MIVKKITNPKKSSSKSARIEALGNYIAEPQQANGKEKCIHCEAHNFLTSDYQAQLAEMVALADESYSKDPVDHWVLSWKADELPTTNQARQAVEIFIKHCGLEGHQYVWGLHDDTDNLHVHIQVNRVHPDTLKVVKINKGFDREAGQQVGALIEHVQGWKPEKGSRYQVMDGKPVLRADTKNKPLEPTATARSMEQQTGTKSAQRIGIEEAAPIIAAARSWRELHNNLNAAGLSFERKGSGAIIFVGDVAVKASDISRAASLSALQKRLGAFQPAKEIHPNEYHHHTPKPHPAATREKPGNGLQNLSERDGSNSTAAGLGIAETKRTSNREHRKPVPLKTNQNSWKEYQVIREENKAEKAAVTLTMRKKHADERDALFNKHKAERKDVFEKSWVGRGNIRNAMASVLATKQAAEKLELQEKLRAEREAVWEKYRLPMYKQWKEQPQIVAEKYLPEREQLVIKQLQPPQLSQLVRMLVPSKNILAGNVTYKLHGTAIFRDHGKTLSVMEQSDQAIAMALAVAQTKFGSTLTLTGPVAFQRKCVEVAVANNLTVKFADPQLEAYRQQLVQNLREFQKPDIRSRYHPDNIAKREAERAMASPPPITKQQAQRVAAPAAEAIPTAPDKSKVEDISGSQKPIAPTALSVEEWIENNNLHLEPKAGEVEWEGKVLYVAADGRWVQSLGRGVVAIRNPAGQPLEVGTMVVVAKDGQVQKMSENGKVLGK